MADADTLVRAGAVATNRGYRERAALNKEGDRDA